MLSQPGILGTNLPSTAPPAVPDSAPLSKRAAGGLGSVTPFEVPTTESPGVVLPTSQEDLPAPPNVFVPNLARSGVVSLGGSLVTGHDHSLSSTRSMDQ